MAALNFNEIVRSIPLLTDDERWKLLSEVAQAIPSGAPRKPMSEFFGALPARKGNVDHWVRNLRGEWER